MSPLRLISRRGAGASLEALTYAVPEGRSPMPSVGARVLVPLGNRTVTGVVDRSRRPFAPEGVARPRTSSTSSTPRRSSPEDVVALAQWVADYYACGAGRRARGGDAARAPCDADAAPSARSAPYASLI